MNSTFLHFCTNLVVLLVALNAISPAQSHKKPTRLPDPSLRIRYVEILDIDLARNSVTCRDLSTPTLRGVDLVDPNLTEEIEYFLGVDEQGKLRTAVSVAFSPPLEKAEFYQSWRQHKNRGWVMKYYPTPRLVYSLSQVGENWHFPHKTQIKDYWEPVRQTAITITEYDPKKGLVTFRDVVTGKADTFLLLGDAGSFVREKNTWRVMKPEKFRQECTCHDWIMVYDKNHNEILTLSEYVEEINSQSSNCAGRELSKK